MLEGLDDIPWERLHHAYGEASDVPAILRDAAEGNAEAIQELFSTVWHQGTVYEATAHAVPFVAELLELPHVDHASLLLLLQLIASGGSYTDAHSARTSRDDATEAKVARELVWVRAAREAVYTQAPRILRCLVGGEERVRAAAACALAGHWRVEGADEALHARLNVEPSELVRASILLSLRPCADADLVAAERGCCDASPLVRVAAAMLLLSRDRVLASPVAVETLREALPGAHRAMQALPATDAVEPVSWIVDELRRHVDVEEQLLATWMVDEDTQVRKDAVYASKKLLLRWRPARPRLVRALSAALEDRDPEVREWAASHLSSAGSAACGAAGELAALLDREALRVSWRETSRVSAEASRAERESAKRTASYALSALCSCQDPRGADEVTRRLSASSERAAIDWSGIPLDALGPWAPACMDPLIDALRAAPAGNTRIALISAIGRYGERAARSIPLIRRELRTHPHIATRVLGDFGPLAHEALEAVRTHLADPDAIVRVNAARAVWRIAGRSDMALPTIAPVLEVSSWYASHAIDALGELGPVALSLAPRLPALFASGNEWISVRAAIAHWRIVGDASAVLPTLSRHVVCQPRGFEAVACLGDIGARAVALAPLLEDEVNRDGCRAESVGRDEAWRALCKRTLDRISAPDV